MSTNIPPYPYAEMMQHNYPHELELAMMARASYETPDAINASMNPSLYQPVVRLLPKSWDLLEDKQNRFIDNNASSGFVATAFELKGQGKIVIAFRGTDNAADWTGGSHDKIGANVALVGDGNLLSEVVGFLDPLSQGPQGRSKEQHREFQQAMMPDWDVQFEEALNYVGRMIKKYGAENIELTGHSLGGALAQVASHTYGLPGRAFDPAGAANIIESKGYQQWLEKNHVTPQQNPAYGYGGEGFLNYKVNYSPVSQDSGPHLGSEDDLSAWSGRQGFGDHAGYIAERTTDLIGSIPLAGKWVKGGKELGDDVEVLQDVLQHGGKGLDAGKKHSMDRIIRVFEEAVNTQHLNRVGQALPTAPTDQKVTPADEKNLNSNATLDDTQPKKSTPLQHPSNVERPFHSLYTQATAFVNKEDERRGRHPMNTVNVRHCQPRHWPSRME